MTLKNYYIQMITEAMMNEDEKTITHYEKLLAELEREEFELKTRIAKKLKKQGK